MYCGYRVTARDQKHCKTLNLKEKVPTLNIPAFQYLNCTSGKDKKLTGKDKRESDREWKSVLLNSANRLSRNWLRSCLLQILRSPAYSIAVLLQFRCHYIPFEKHAAAPREVRRVKSGRTEGVGLDTRRLKNMADQSTVTGVANRYDSQYPVCDRYPEKPMRRPSSNSISPNNKQQTSKWTQIRNVVL